MRGTRSFQGDAEKRKTASHRTSSVLYASSMEETRMSQSPVGLRGSIHSPPSAFLIDCKRKIRVHVGREIKARFFSLSFSGLSIPPNRSFQSNKGDLFSQTGNTCEPALAKVY